MMYLCIMERPKVKYRDLTLHVLCWTALVVMPLFFHNPNDTWGEVWNRYLHSLGNPIAYMLIFYINYLWLVPKFLLRKHSWARFILINIVVLAVGFGIISDWFSLIHDIVPGLDDNWHTKGGHRPQFFRHFYSTLVEILFIALAVAIRMYQRWQHIEQARKDAEAARTQAELSNLRNQLNPHFLLNTLNNIYALIAFDQDKAQTAVGQLSKMLRHMLYDNQQDFVPLYKEVDFIQNYIELMKIRVTSGVKITTAIDVRPDDATPVAPLLFISLIENAFKHGISPQGTADISIGMERREGGAIVCDIRNSYYPKHENDKSGSGIGLEQVQRRLDLMYSDHYTWDKGVTSDGTQYYSIITIQS